MKKFEKLGTEGSTKKGLAHSQGRLPGSEVVKNGIQLRKQQLEA